MWQRTFSCLCQPYEFVLSSVQTNLSTRFFLVSPVQYMFSPDTASSDVGLPSTLALYPSVILSLNLRLLDVLRLGLESFLRCHIKPFCFSEGKISSSALLEDWRVSSLQRRYSVYASLSYTRALSNMFIGDFASRRDDDDSPIPLRVLSLSSCLPTRF